MRVATVMRTTVPLAKAKAELSRHVKAAERGETLMITRHGTPIAALVPAADVAALERLRAAGPEGGLASVAGGWPGSKELVKRVAERPRRGFRAKRG